MDRRRFLFSSTLAVAPLLVGCRQDGPLQVSYHPWIGYETFCLADQFRWLPAGVSLTRRNSALESLDALRTDRADGAALTLDEVIRARGQGLDLVVVLVFNVSSGADVLMAAPSITDTPDLAGRRIGVESSAVGGMLLDRILEEAGLGRDDVTVVDLAADRHVKAWRDGRVDAMVSYEPVASRLEQTGARRLRDSRDYPDTIFDVLAVRRDRIDGARQTLGGLIAAHFRALEHLRLSRQDAIYRISEVEAIAPEAVRQALGGVLMPGLRANARYLSPGSRLTTAASELRQRLRIDGGPGDDWYTDTYLPPGESLDR
ncbi:MAG: ABC transporter substrate-binding protein [Pseudomonadota bacterium]